MLFRVLLSIVSLLIAASAPIDDYVWRYDENYKWVDMGPEYMLKGSIGNRGYTAYTLNMTSQRWLTDDEFTADSEAKSIWWHYLVVIVPDNLHYTRNASLWITGGGMGSSPPSQRDEDIIVSASLATQTGMVTGALFQIPNEHITFTSDPIKKSRSEDAIIAFTWDHFLNDPSNPEWLLRFPMVKASVRAMDTITDFMAKTYPDKGFQLDYYSVAGASKRGWTTWMVGAVDPKRVMIIVPVVLDAINFVAVEHHQYRAYGGWTYALQDYIDMNITTRFDDPNMVKLQENVDPYFFKERLTMPKFVINAVMDEFQQPDDTHYWWNDMPEPKHFLIAPNAEHSLATGILDVTPAIGAFIQAHILKEHVPQLHWTIDETTGEIVVTLDHISKVHEANVWWAYSCGSNAFDNGTFRRDYRVAHLDNPCACGIYAAGYCANLKSVWDKKALEVENVDGKRIIRANVEPPTDGRWVAFLVDIKFHNKNAWPIDTEPLYKTMIPNEESMKPGHGFTRKVEGFGGFPHDFGRFFEFTSEVSIMPNTFPYPDCSGEDCGTRVV